MCMFAAVGFRIGQSQQISAADAASTWQTAAAAAFAPARASAYRAGWRHGYQRGWVAGVAAGSSAGAGAGALAGRSEAAAGSAVARSVASVLAATPIRLEPGIKTERCIEIADGLCETLGPQITGHGCPSGSVADPQGGVVCVPQVLLLAARLANAPGAGVFAR